MNTTEKLQLNMPEASEAYDIEKFNENARKIDAAVISIEAAVKAAQDAANSAASAASAAQKAADTAQAAADKLTAMLGQVNGIATLDESGDVPVSQVPWSFGTEDLEAGVSPLPTGHLYFVYE